MEGLSGQDVPAVRLQLEEEPGRVEVHLEMPEYIPAKGVSHLRLEGFTNTGSIKGWAVPVRHELILIDSREGVELSYTVENPKVFEGVSLPAAWVPQADGRKAGAPETVEAPVELLEVLTYRGQSMALVRVSPFVYEPAEKKLVYYGRINYSLTSRAATSPSAYSEKMARQLNRIVLNPRQTDQRKSGEAGQPGHILMVTADTFLQQLDTLRQWKAQMGYKTELISAAEWTADSLEAVIKAYWEESEIKPDYLWLIGDVEHVPARLDSVVDPDDLEVSYYPTDLYYVCMDGYKDYVPEMHKARLPVSDSSELTAFIHRLIRYTADPPELDSYYESATVLGEFQDDDEDSYSDRRFIKTCEEIRDHLQQRNYQVERVYYTDGGVTPYYYNDGYYANGEMLPFELWKSNDFKWNGGMSASLKAFRNGRFLLFYRGHGAPTFWSHPYLSASQLHWVDNLDVLPVVFSHTCNTGMFDQEDSFAETLLVSETGGAIAAYAASDVSYSGYNDALSIGMVDAIWPRLVPEFGTGGNSSPQISDHAPMYTLGDLLTQGLLRMTQTWGGSGLISYQYGIYHLFGDPTLDMHVRKPLDIAASAVDIRFPADGQMRVEAAGLEGAKVSLVAGTELLAYAEIQEGSALLDADYEASVLAEALITISKPGYIPYVQSYQGALTPASVREFPQMRLYPNPSAGVFRLEMPDGMAYRTKVYDMTGRLILQKFSQGGTGELDLTGKPKGLYLLRLQMNDGRVKTLRLVHQ